MKLMIDIPEYLYTAIKAIQSYNKPLTEEERAIANGTPIPDNATNGDMFLIEHPDVVASVIKKKGNLFDVIQLRHKGDTLPFAEIYADWWNAPYQKGGKVNE